MMRFPAFVVAFGIGSLALGGLVVAQQAELPGQPSRVVTAQAGETSLLVAQADSSKMAPAQKGAKEDSPRLPNHYGKLELTGAQKDELYTIQKKYDTQLDALEKQIEELKTQREADLKKVLTDAQKSKLQEIQNAAKTKKAKPAAEPAKS